MSRACGTVPNTTTCSSLPSGGYRGRPLLEPCGSPPSQVLWNHKTAHYPCLRLRFPLAAGDSVLKVRSLLLATPSPARDRVLLIWAAPCAHLGGEAVSSPGFTGNPYVSMPWTSDPGDSEHTSHGGVLNTVFRHQKGVDITIRHISGLNSHGLLTHCVRFAPTSHPVNGNTRYRPARYRFDRTGLAPVGLHQKVSLAHPSSPYSALFPARSGLCRASRILLQTSCCVPNARR